MLVIKGRVFYRGRLEPLSIGIDEGRIVAVRKILRGDEEVDHGDALVLPGCIDMHVHLREPGLTEKEDFASGTRSAALGGVTTVFDMPNTRPPVSTRPDLEEKAARVRGRAAVDYGLYAAPRSGSAVPRLLGADAFKVYMAESTGGLQIGTEELEEVLAASAEADRLVVVHAEDAGKFTTPSTRGLEGHHMARPKESEVSALQLLSKVRGEARLHVAHVTCVEALDAIPDGATTEASPHHLLLDFRRDLKGFGKVNPPLRPPEDRDALWRAFVDGRIDVVASDHAPHTQEEKAGALTLERLVRTMADRPAEILGLPKGLIEVGRDADLVVVDPRRTETVRAKRIRYKCGWTPFEGMDACFPQTVYLRGDAVVDHGETAAENLGRPITAAKR